ncbi:hypothetical protein [Pseudomonas sp. GXZC]|uniref:hypothetical protein n=1 Tax=Pseudomonas sp. GXZC TaxID=3003351 RepID=UPI0022AAB7F3|nr:hypothetical protein [Pseudomonas sp. GXZC]WAT30141.1 hypothetical protein OZ428_07330 [Pseudomonas sp. GXZC]
MTDYTELQRLAEHHLSLGHAYTVATPAAVLALIAENERVKARLCVCRDCGGQGEVYSGHSSYQGHNQPPEPDMDVCGTCGGDGVLGSLEDFEALAAERDQLKAENEALRKDAESRIEWAKEASAEIDRLQGIEAKCEALRDDSEQKQYDANAWRNGEESVWVEVFNSEGDDQFISAISGQITVEQLALIQAEIREYREDYFEKGSGLYVFRCAHYQAHYDNVGMTEPAHWETDFESYSPFPWEEEAAAMDNGEQS